MPIRPGKPCAWPGCRAIVRGRYCPRHAAVYDAQRPRALERGYNARHRAWRDAVLNFEPWCRDPDHRHLGDWRRSTHADHVVPLAHGGTWLIDNGQGLCASCHAAKTATHDGGWGNRRR